VAKEFLSQRGIPFTEKDVSRDPVAAQEMLRRSHQRGVPVITVGDDVIVGFDRPRIEQALARWAERPRTQTARPRFGATVADAASALARRGKPVVPGAYVGVVSPDTPAARAGLRPGDVIVELNGRRIASADDLERALSGESPGAQVSLTVARDGRHVRLATRL
jgi:S1-C subfamily serine protease